MIRCKLSCAHLSGHAFENSISEPVAAAEMFGQLNRLVENDAVRRLRAAQQLIRPDEKNRTLNERYALQVAVDKRRKLSFKRSVLADRSRKQCREQLTVAARPVFRRKTEIFNGRAFLIIGKERRKIFFNFLGFKRRICDPLIEAEQRKDAGEMPRCMRLAAGLMGFSNSCPVRSL